MFSLHKREHHFFILPKFLFFAFNFRKVMDRKTILTITGSDGTGGSGVQADIKTISSLGGYAVSAVTSITVQNTLGIQQFYDIPAHIVSGQVEAIINDMEPVVVKIGMVRSVSVLMAIVNALVKYCPQFVIYDPVVYSSKGEQLMTDDVICKVRERLLPLCHLVIVRKAEAHVVFDEIDDDRIYLLDESLFHGFTNNFSSAVAFYLTQNMNKAKALKSAHDYIRRQVVLQHGLTGRGWELYQSFLHLLSNHVRTNSDVAFYADKLNVSSRYLAQVCKRSADKSPKAIIDENLVGKVETELTASSKTIQEIAFEFGFSSQAHLSKFFKKWKGISPTAYRTK